MLKSTIFLAVSALVGAVIGQAGSLTQITMTPDQAGGTVLGDQTKGGPGYGNSSWQNGSAGPADKGEVYIPVSLLFSGPVTIGEIQSISYMTNNPTAGILNWSLYIYTNKTGAGDSASWYRSRLTAEPYLAPNYSPTEAENNWETWSTSDPLQPLRFYDGNRMGTGTPNNYNGSMTDPLFADILAGPVAVHGGTWDYRNETVEYISLQVGSSWAALYQGDLDGLDIVLSDGREAQVNFEAAPEPGTGLLVAACLGGWLLRRRAVR